jgi:hypothetical protein
MTADQTKMPKAKVVYATVSDAGDALHIECRFDNDEKYAAVTVDADKEQLAFDICNFLNRRDLATAEVQGLVDMVEKLDETIRVHEDASLRLDTGEIKRISYEMRKALQKFRGRT